MLLITTAQQHARQLTIQNSKILDLTINKLHDEAIQNIPERWTGCAAACGGLRLRIEETKTKVEGRRRLRTTD